MDTHIQNIEPSLKNYFFKLENSVGKIARDLEEAFTNKDIK